MYPEFENFESILVYFYSIIYFYRIDLLPTIFNKFCNLFSNYIDDSFINNIFLTEDEKELLYRDKKEETKIK